MSLVSAGERWAGCRKERMDGWEKKREERRGEERLFGGGERRACLEEGEDRWIGGREGGKEMRRVAVWLKDRKDGWIDRWQEERSEEERNGD
jgi:hypothetical protein